MPSKLFNKFTQSGYPRRSSYTEVSQSEISRLEPRSPISSSSSSTAVGGKKRSAVAWSLAAVGVILTFTNLLGAALYFAANRHICDGDVRLDDEKEGGYGFSLLPSLRDSIVPVTFEPDYRFWNMSDFRSEQAWNPLGRHGDIFVKTPEKYGLPPGIEKGSSEYQGFPLSVFHQLHCLKMLRMHYAALLTMGQEMTDKVSDHPDHCFDYLRQAIMCSADMTLEKARVDPDGHRRATDGWGSTHQCKDWGRVEEVMVDYGWKYAS